LHLTKNKKVGIITEICFISINIMFGLFAMILGQIG
jgi:hypothetical protein